LPNDSINVLWCPTRFLRHKILESLELPTFPEYMRSSSIHGGIRATRSLVLYVMFCRSLFGHLYFFYWSLCCLSFFNLRIIITHLVSSDSSSKIIILIKFIYSCVSKNFSRHCFKLLLLIFIYLSIYLFIYIFNNLLFIFTVVNSENWKIQLKINKIKDQRRQTSTKTVWPGVSKTQHLLLIV
jgi:hypothetical protein